MDARPNYIVPQDVIEEMLSRLPVESLLRFKCVSKSWNSLISGPSLARMHLDRAIFGTNILGSTLPGGLKLFDYETSFRYKVPFDFPPKRKNHRVKIMGSWHGLEAVSLESNRDFFLWNPSTGDYEKLPDYRGCFPSTGYGFGYDLSTDDYKVFVSTWTRDVFVSQIKKSWTMIQPPITNLLFFPNQNRYGCFVNGAPHWLSGERQTETEGFGSVAVPNEVNNKFIMMNMGVLDGRLCLTVYHCKFYP